MTIKRNRGKMLPVLVLGLQASVALADQDQDDVLAVADKALERITAEDSIGLTDLMIEDAMIYVGSFSDGEYQVGVRTYADTRARAMEDDFVERGFDPTVLVSGPIAMVWYPYDFYSNGEWSHCGVDIFTLARTNQGWRITTLMFNSQQPPECEPHPDGPPAGD
jgi:hypothetical protein